MEQPVQESESYQPEQPPRQDEVKRNIPESVSTVENSSDQLPAQSGTKKDKSPKTPSAGRKPEPKCSQPATTKIQQFMALWGSEAEPEKVKTKLPEKQTGNTVAGETRSATGKKTNTPDLGQSCVKASYQSLFSKPVTESQESGNRKATTRKNKASASPASREASREFKSLVGLGFSSVDETGDTSQDLPELTGLETPETIRGSDGSSQQPGTTEHKQDPPMIDSGFQEKLSEEQENDDEPELPSDTKTQGGDQAETSTAAAPEPVSEMPDAPDHVPDIEPAVKATLTAGQDLAMASSLLSLDGFSSLKDLMGMYRTGRMFDFGQVSLDDLTAEELLASTGLTNTVPIRDRRPDVWHSFVQVYEQQSSYKGQQEQSGWHYKGYGLNTGVFSQATEDLVLGLMFGVQKGAVGRKDIVSSATMESVRFGPFLSWSRNDWHVDAALLLSLDHYSLKRQDNMGHSLKADFSGTGLHGYIALGYDFHMDHWAPGMVLTPMAELLYSHNSFQGFRETGLSDQAMSVGSQSTDSLLTRLGTELSYVFPDLETPSVLSVRLGWQHHHVGGGTTSYELPEQGVSGKFERGSSNDSGLFYGLSFSRQVSGQSSISLNYFGTHTRRGNSQGLQLHYEWKF
ncbi:MAG: autotransporter domain-containing protein, partial [Endozoicomonas sp.]